MRIEMNAFVSISVSFSLLLRPFALQFDVEHRAHGHKKDIYYYSVLSVRVRCGRVLYVFFSSLNACSFLYCCCCCFYCCLLNRHDNHCLVIVFNSVQCFTWWQFHLFPYMRAHKPIRSVAQYRLWELQSACTIQLHVYVANSFWDHFSASSSIWKTKENTNKKKRRKRKETKNSLNSRTYRLFCWCSVPACLSAHHTQFTITFSCKMQINTKWLLVRLSSSTQRSDRSIFAVRHAKWRSSCSGLLLLLPACHFIASDVNNDCRKIW